MYILISNLCALLAAGWIRKPALHIGGRPIHSSTDSLTISLTDLMIISLPALSTCARASRARRKPWLIAELRTAIPSAPHRRAWNSQLLKSALGVDHPLPGAENISNHHTREVPAWPL